MFPKPHTDGPSDRDRDERARHSRLRRRLLARIARNYRTVEREIAIGHLRLRFVQIANPDYVLDQLVAEADRREKASGRKEPDNELHLPYWAELWDSALGIGEWLVENCRLPIADCRLDARENATGIRDSHLAIGNRQSPIPQVLDLGCGLGLAGTVAAAMGYRVFFADIETPPLLFARLNSSVYAARVRARRVDWRRDQLDERFDLILGADVLYDRAQWEHLEAFFRAHLRESRGASVLPSVLLGEPGRQTGEMFVPWIQQRGWRLEQSLQRVASREKPIRVFRILRG